jgi:hypothetical protein
MNQIDRVKFKLKRDGFITRNECLSQYPAITRLSAHILTLKKEGYQFKVEDDGRDYKYKVAINI